VISQAKGQAGFFKTFVLGRTKNPKFGLSFKASQSRYFNHRQLELPLVLAGGDLLRLIKTVPL
jgi:hypothetical protein